MTEADRDRLRKLQDRWLEIPRIKRWIAEYGENANMFPYQVVTANMLRCVIYPEMEYVFRRDLEDRDGQ